MDTRPAPAWRRPQTTPDADAAGAPLPFGLGDRIRLVQARVPILLILVVGTALRLYSAPAY